jgi:hypothetical protein
MPDPRRIAREIMRCCAPHSDTRENGALQPRAMALHLRHATQTFDCISRTLEGQPGHSRLQASMPDDEEIDCAQRKTITWTPIAFLSSLGHDTGFSTSEGFNKEKGHQDWTSYHCQYLGLTIPHLAEFKHHKCPCKRFAIDDFGDHLHTYTQHAGATSGAHEHILTALQRLFTKAGYRTDRKHVPRSRGLKKADLLIKDFQLQGVRDVIVDVTCRHEFRGSCANQERNVEPSHLDVNGALDATVKEKLDHYQHDYNERNFFFLPAVTTTSGRISGDFLRLLYMLSHRQAAN